ncbi:unnamed protein product [Adineta ricciae]|uniref:Uncharacterized protein n=1 Tax=Adineta ricciae TaxID=249248 RepID=A0A815FAW6_ADIRI|nr:unnamed protein product [Adineta ricciae]CAF1316759.1 unnamed protein product [Adineta ricciae]
MLYYFIFAIVGLVSFSGAQTLINDSCESHVDKLSTCAGTISFSGDCYSSKIELRDTEYVKCTDVNFFWSYPLNNMTLVIETPFTQKRQRFTVSLETQPLQGAVSHVYRIIDDQETDVTTREPILTQDSDANYQVILKFQGPTRLSRYGVVIQYESTVKA